ncbi:hypothetical protein RJT34_28547 [Clitoria ternatea]|uniref:FAS1 domain-containing protein n=1 Tax=Clitoria ternatea TaxID=43366 RepID=A0AAN9F9F8_CLITE
MENQYLLPFSLPLLLIPLLCPSTLAALSPTNAPIKAPSAAPTTTPLVPILPQPPPSDTNNRDIVGILRRANTFNIFIRLMKTTQLVNQINSQLITIKSGGLTILAPEDSAFSELKPGFLNTLSDAQKLELVQFHVLPDLVSSSNFDTLTNPVRTLAGNKRGKVELNVISYGGSVNISTGVVNTTINGIVYMDNHLGIYKVGNVLLPSDFFPPKKLASAPSLAPEPATDAVAKAPKPDKVKAPSSEDSSVSSQVVPTQISAAFRIAMCGMWVSFVLGVVNFFLALFTP